MTPEALIAYIYAPIAVMLLAYIAGMLHKMDKRIFALEIKAGIVHNGK